MAYAIKLSDDRKYIVIMVEGFVDNDMAMEYTIESQRLGKKEGISRYLVDLTQSRNVQSVGLNFEFIDRDLRSTDEVDIRGRVALLVSPEDHSHDFIETLSINRGINVRLFRNRADAVAHLLKERS